MQSSILMVISGVFLSIAMLFKLGAFPFHMWLCDVYDGSNVCITAFFSAVPKVILLGFFIKSLFYPFASDLQVVNIFLLASGLSSVCFASLIALYQKRVKRLVAYSTVSHSGFILLGLCCSTIDSVKSCLVYIVVYILMTLTLFSIMFLSGINNSQQKYIIN
jgi:NADH-quinone oxidoreductase subunit N